MEAENFNIISSAILDGIETKISRHVSNKIEIQQLTPRIFDGIREERIKRNDLEKQEKGEKK